MKDYRVDLDVYNGPLDLLLYLIRREEVDIYDIPIARITIQFISYVNLIKEIDPNVAGEFLVLAASLMEIKSRSLLPSPPPEEVEEEFSDPRLELVRQLIEYKNFKDAASRLGVAAGIQSLKHPRSPGPLPAGAAEVDLDEVEIWDLLEAFNKLLEATGRRQQKHEVIYDDTPLALHATDILDSLTRAGGSQRFESIFEGRNRSQLVGLFLALLELVRRKRVRIEQQGPFGPIIIHVLDASPITDNLNDAFEPELPEQEAPAAVSDETDTDDADEAAADPTDALENDAAPDADEPETVVPVPQTGPPPTAIDAASDTSPPPPSADDTSEEVST